MLLMVCSASTLYLVSLGSIILCIKRNKKNADKIVTLATLLNVISIIFIVIGIMEIRL